jgi:hypothetical protein
MKPDDTELELLRLARELDEGRTVDWGHTADPELVAGIEVFETSRSWRRR